MCCKLEYRTARNDNAGCELNMLRKQESFRLLYLTVTPLVRESFRQIAVIIAKIAGKMAKDLSEYLNFESENLDIRLLSAEGVNPSLTRLHRFGLAALNYF